MITHLHVRFEELHENCILSSLFDFLHAYVNIMNFLFLVYMYLNFFSM